MQAASVIVTAVGFLSLASPSPHDTFRYVIASSFRQVEDVCRLCYADDCLDIEAARCEYFQEVDEITAKDEPGGPGSAVDDMINDLTEEAAMSWWTQKCIPLISYYTSCNKENLCLGCDSCYCSTDGNWLCKRVQQCRHQPTLDINHRTLFSAMESLLEKEQKSRKKRLVETVTDKEVIPIGLVDIAQWMYGATPDTNMDLTTVANNNIENAINIAIETTSDNETEKLLNSTFTETSKQLTLSTQTESEYLGFEEVLKNIANDQIYKRRKSQLHEDSDTTFDYMDIDDTKPPEKILVKGLNDLEEGNNKIESSTDGKFVIDLYPHKNTNDYDEDANAADYFNSLLYKDDNNTIDSSHEKIEMNSVNIMKRDVSFVPHVDNIRQQTTVTTATFETTTSSNVTDKGSDLKDSVLIPLTNIIHDKQNEVKELLQIKENLVRIMKVYYNSTNANITKENVKNDTDSHFLGPKLDLYPEIHGNLRRINPNVTEKLLYKLKRDIYEVFKDIARIQRLSKNLTLPNDLKTLIRAMKYYVNKQGGVNDFKDKENTTMTRRHWMRRIPTESKSIVKQLVEILDVIDKDSSQPQAFLNLTKAAKKIVKRVVKQNYVDDMSSVGYRVFDTEYSLTGDLRTIGKSWPILTAKLANSSPHEKLYALKLLHFTLSGDMNKITDAIALVDFAHSRRMSPIETPMAEEVIERINSGLLSIKNKVQTLMKYQLAQEKNELKENRKTQKKKKESFFRRVKNLLMGSRKEIIDMARNKVPKSEIFKTIAKKKLKELAHKKLAEDEQTMLKWQKTLHVTRKKRDIATHIKTMKSRMKNIIPKYLRGKIDPAITKHKSKKQGFNKKKSNKKASTTTAAKPIISTLSPLMHNINSLMQ